MHRTQTTEDILESSRWICERQNVKKKIQRLIQGVYGGNEYTD